MRYLSIFEDHLMQNQINLQSLLNLTENEIEQPLTIETQKQLLAHLFESAKAAGLFGKN